MHKTFVHIGLHKTATTWLQNELFIKDNSSFEPLSIKTKRKGHSSLANQFIFDTKGFLLNSFDNNEGVITKNLDLILKQKDGIDKILVMSHERLSGYPTSSGFDSSIIMKRIKNIFPNTKILIMIREQKSLILSNYFEYLKEGGVGDIDRFLNSKYDGRVPNFSENYFQFHHMILGYQSSFGTDNVLVVPYEIFSSDKIAFMNKISHFLNEEIDFRTDNFSIKHNSKNHHYINYHFRWLNYFIKSSSSLNSAKTIKRSSIKSLALAFKKLMISFSTQKMDEKTKFKLQTKVETWSSDKFSESNKLTSDAIGIDLSKLGYSV